MFYNLLDVVQSSNSTFFWIFLYIVFALVILGLACSLIFLLISLGRKFWRK